MARRDELAEIAPEQPAIDQEEQQPRADAGDEQGDIDRRERKIDQDRARRRTQAEPGTAQRRDAARGLERLRVVPRLDRDDHVVGKRHHHRDRDRAE